MGYTSEEELDVSESEIEDYAEEIYQQLQTGSNRVKISEICFRCPFCQGKKKQDYGYKDLLQHAAGVGSSNRKVKEKASHQALARFLTNDIVDIHGPSQIKVEPKSAQTPGSNEQFVWPWMGILVNLPTELQDGKMVGESASELRERYSQYNPVKVHALYNMRGHTGNAVVEFKKDWAGFKDAVAFSGFFASSFHGKNQWNEHKSQLLGVYGWLAQEDYYESSGPIGELLREIGDLKTIADLEQEEIQKTDILVANLTSEIDAKNKSLRELECKYNETSISLSKVMEDRNRLDQAYNEAIRRLQYEASSHLTRVYQDNAKQRLELDDKIKELELRSQELDKSEAQNENERRIFEEQKQKNVARNSSLQKASLEQQKADENVFRLVEAQKRVKKQVLDEMIKLEKQLDAKQKLELDIEQIKGKLLVLEHMDGVDDCMHTKMMEIKKELEEKECEMEDLEALNQALIVRERKSSDELQEARKELINSLTGMLSAARTTIGIKRMGDLDEKSFHTASRRKFTENDADDKVGEPVSFKEHYIKDPGLHPYKIVTADGKNKVIIDEDDEKLTGLLTQGGQELHNRYSVQELWNMKEDRKATMKEVIQFIFRQWKVHKRKR